MQLSATTLARFFIQDEYQQIEIKDQCVILSSLSDEVHIPFGAWNGKVTIERGLVWGNLYFHAHEKAGEQLTWLVQGLPWPQCRHFAQHVVGEYRRWQLDHTQALAELLPHWAVQLQALVNQTGYLTHSEVYAWIETVKSDIEQHAMTFSDAIHLFPDASSESDGKPYSSTLLTQMKAWLITPEDCIEARNRIWLHNQEAEWQDYFQTCESSPLNPSQRKAVLLNADQTLVLAGAGTGKTSILMSKVGYLLESQQAKPEEILLLAFGQDAAQEMQYRLNEKLADQAHPVKVMTFHQLGLHIIQAVEGEKVALSPLATDPELKNQWLANWLSQHWMTETNSRRWRKHLAEWPIAFLRGDVDLSLHTKNPKLLSWLAQQVDRLSAMQSTKKQIQEQLIHLENYPQLNSELMLAWPCYQAWQNHLKENQQIDFNAMIINAISCLEKGKFQPPWRTILVDEYQDISPKRLQLLEALTQQGKQKVLLEGIETEKPCTLFAVGDDWQAIYRFAGGEVSLTTDFQQRFPFGQIHYLDITYRFNNQIAQVANRFIQQNPNQLPKTLHSIHHQKQKAVVIAPMARLEKILTEMNNRTTERKTVLILGRKHDHEPNQLRQWQKINLHLDIEFKTCHASKGQEADYVILVSVDDGQFPAVQRQTHLHDALLGQEESFPYAEERRLFYVAMTRAKEGVWLLHNAYPSSFIKELRAGRYPVIVHKR